MKWLYLFVLLFVVPQPVAANDPLPPPVAPSSLATPLPPPVAPSYAPGTRLITQSGIAIVFRDGQWWVASSQPDYYPAAPVVAVQVPFPAVTTPPTTALPAVGSNYPYMVGGQGGHILIGAPTTARYGGTRPFSGSYGVTANCGPLG